MRNTALLYLLPVIIVLLITETLYDAKEKKELYNFKDTLCNFLIGVGYLISNSFSKMTVYLLLVWSYHWHLFPITNSWYWWVICFFANDITFYAYHRTSHEVNWFWLSHSVHHSSNKMNISTAFRQSWTTNISGHGFFWIWMAVIGFPPIMVLITLQVSLLYQYVLHTETVKRLPKWIEYLFNTPSHHRVHHGSNPEYLDKNHGGVLIIWDRIFGTYAEENTQPTYGLSTPLISNNPVEVIFHPWNEFFIKLIHSKSLKEVVGCFLGAPGWSPDKDIHLKLKD